jgi:hypothetical protein
MANPKPSRAGRMPRLAPAPVSGRECFDPTTPDRIQPCRSWRGTRIGLRSRVAPCGPDRHGSRARTCVIAPPPFHVPPRPVNVCNASGMAQREAAGLRDALSAYDRAHAIDGMQRMTVRRGRVRADARAPTVGSRGIDSLLPLVGSLQTKRGEVRVCMPPRGRREPVRHPLILYTYVHRWGW